MLFIGHIESQISKLSEEFEATEEKSLKSVRRKFESMPKRAKLRLLIRVVVIGFCISGLIVQAIELFVQYSSRRTVVNMKIEIIKYNKLPAITICVPLFSMQRLAERYEELKPLYDEYMKSLNTTTPNDYRNETFIKSLFDLYLKNFTDFVDKSKLNFSEIFDLSTPFEEMEEMDQNVMRYPIIVEIRGYRRFTNGSVVQWDVRDVSPIESIALDAFEESHKCFTFFSHLNVSWRKYQMDVKRIDIRIFNFDRHVPKVLFFGYPFKFSMHSPHTIPQRLRINDFVDIKANHRMDITYNRWKTVLLGPKYQTNCRDYDLDDTQGYRLRSNCVNHCINQRLNECTKNKREAIHVTHEDCLFPIGAIWNKQTYPLDRDMKVCPFKPSELSLQTDPKLQCMHNPKGVSNCELNCRSECINRYYNYDIKNSELNYRWNGTQITILHNQLPDQITEHIPEMTFISFIANFGGLLGMWLGLSALAIIDFIIKLF